MAETASRQLVTLAQKASTLRDLLVLRKGELQSALPRHMTADRLVRLALTACTKQPRLLECTQASLYSALLQCAQLGLEPDLLNSAHLVPFRNTKQNRVECQLIPGYQGLLGLARRSGEIASVEARSVRKPPDRFRYKYGLTPILEHEPKDNDDDKPLTHAYAIARYLHGGLPSFVVMTRKEIEKRRKRSRAADSGPWVTDFEAMALKTVLRELCKLLPSSIELKTAVALDEAHDAGLPQNLPDVAGLEIDAPMLLPGEEHKPGNGEAKPELVSCSCPDAPNGIHVPECSKGKK